MSWLKGRQECTLRNRRSESSGKFYRILPRPLRQCRAIFAGNRKIIKPRIGADIPDARLIPTQLQAGSAAGDLWPHLLDLDGLIARVQPQFKANDFYEKEIARTRSSSTRSLMY